MFYVSDPVTTPPAQFSTELQRLVYETFASKGIPFERVDTDPGITMEDCRHIDAKIGVPIVKTLFLCNRQQTEFYLYVTSDDRPFVTRDFCGSLGIPRVSFASAERLWELTGVQVGATTILSAILPSAASVRLVMDEPIARAPWFACTDGTATCFVKIRTRDLLDKYLEGKKLSIIRSAVAYGDEEYVFGQEDGAPYVLAHGRRFRLSCHPYEPCLYVTDKDGVKTIVHHCFEPSALLEIFREGRIVTSITGRKYDARDFCRLVEYAAGKGELEIDDAEKVFGDAPKKKGSAGAPAAERFALSGERSVEGLAEERFAVIRDCPVYDLVRDYPDAVPEFCLVKQEGPAGGGIEAHRSALEAACRRLMAGDEETEPWHYDVAKAEANRMSVRDLFTSEEIPGKFSYRRAFLSPPWGCDYTEADFQRINAALFPAGTEQLEIFEWTTGWSDYFDDGHEWWGALCLTIYDPGLHRFVVILASATD